VLLGWLPGVGALIGAAIMPERDDAGQFELFVKGMEGLAAGAMLTMIAQVHVAEVSCINTFTG
jgi:hypothetical protein